MSPTGRTCTKYVHLRLDSIKSILIQSKLFLIFFWSGNPLMNFIFVVLFFRPLNLLFLAVHDLLLFFFRRLSWFDWYTTCFVSCFLVVCFPIFSSSSSLLLSLLHDDPPPFSFRDMPPSSIVFLHPSAIFWQFFLSLSVSFSTSLFPFHTQYGFGTIKWNYVAY